MMVPVLLGGVALGCGFLLAGSAHSLWQFNLAQGLLIGLLGSFAVTAFGIAPLAPDATELPRRLTVAETAAVWPVIAIVSDQLKHDVITVAGILIRKRTCIAFLQICSDGLLNR